jgi:hypothetical protein|tara:strand:+ start:522 stop:776 length:255 start_codon:yes stop_codon:yes gene_type:complete
MSETNEVKEIDITNDLGLLEKEIGNISEQLRQVDENRMQLITKLQQIQGAAAYLRGKQDPTPEENVAAVLDEEEKSEEESTDNK